MQNADVADNAVILDARAGRVGCRARAELSPSRWANSSRLHELPDTDAGTLAVTCRGGGAPRGRWRLGHQGFDVANLEGGMKGWLAAGKSVVSEGGEPRVI